MPDQHARVPGPPATARSVCRSPIQSMPAWTTNPPGNLGTESAATSPKADSMYYSATTIPYAQRSTPTPRVMSGRRRGSGSRFVLGWPRRVRRAAGTRRHVGLDGGLTEVQLRRNIGIGAPGCNRGGYLALAVAQPANRAVADARRSLIAVSAKRASKVRVTAGDSIASSAATTLTAFTMSVGGVSFTRRGHARLRRHPPYQLRRRCG